MYGHVFIDYCWPFYHGLDLFLYTNISRRDWKYFNLWGGLYEKEKLQSEDLKVKAHKIRGYRFLRGGAVTNGITQNPFFS